MSYRIEVTRRFEKDFKKLPNEITRRLDPQIRGLGENPLIGKRLRGEFDGCYSLRVGDYRVIYAVDNSAKRITLLTIGHRSRVYE